MPPQTDFISVCRRLPDETDDIRTVACRGLGHLQQHIEQLRTLPDCAICRGRLRTAPDVPPWLEDAPHHWCAVDLEGIVRPDEVSPADLPACAELAMEFLPFELRREPFIIQARPDHGRRRGCHLRFWFWLDEPLGGKALAYLFRRSPVDVWLFAADTLIHSTGPAVMRRAPVSYAFGVAAE